MSEHIHGAGCVGQEVPGYYDGVLYSYCSDGEWRNDWAPGSNRWARAEAAIRLARRTLDAGGLAGSDGHQGTPGNHEAAESLTEPQGVAS